jgi:hypothetical protein
MFYTIFNKSNIALIAWFLAIYIVVYCFFGILFRRTDTVNSYETKLGSLIDIIFLFVSGFFIVTTYFTISTNDKIALLQNTYDWSVNFIEEPFSIFATLIFAFFFYAAVYLFRVPMTYDTRPIFIYFIECIVWLFAFLIILYDFFKYVLHISLSDIFDKLDLLHYFPEGVPTAAAAVSSPVDLSGAPTAAPNPKNEVFNISNNLYTYDDAAAVCSAYGAKVATYDQIENAYNNGAEWCNYGWSEGQMGYFPTQKSTWETLQKNPIHKNDCGRPGVNGGYFANPNLKFGVNCYGKKPNPTDADLTMLSGKQNNIVPATPEEIELENKINYWKQNPGLMQVNSYNNKQWSQY